MKPQKQKIEFIRLRAENRSYRFISEKLNISKATCSSWEKAFKSKIAEFKDDQLNELYSSYFMTKEARIRQLGDTLKGIDQALGEIDLKQLPPDKLLHYKLKYTKALEEEYYSTYDPLTIRASTIDEPLDNLLGLSNNPALTQGQNQDKSEQELDCVTEQVTANPEAV